MLWGLPQVLRGDGGGTTIYLGRRVGAPYIGVGLKGFSGWSSSRWMPGGWEFLTPYIHAGRLFSDTDGHWWDTRVLVPSNLWDFYYWRIKPSGRRYMREHHARALTEPSDDA